MRKKRILFLLLLLLGVSILWAGRLQKERTGTAENLTEEEKLSSNVQEMPQETADITPVQRMTQMQGAKEPAQEVQDTQEGLFYYEALSDAEKEAYCQIYTALISRQKETLSILDSGRAEVLYQYVLNDHPEIFYSSSFSMEGRERNGVLSSLSVQPVYTMTTQQQQEKQQQIDQTTTAVLTSMPAGLDAYGQVKYVYDYVIDHTDYVLDSPDNQNICSVFLNGESVCQGYAKATQYLLKKLGFEVTLVFGTEQTGADHVWNLVKVDGDYYYMDTTWGEMQFSDQGESRGINYNFLLITTEELLQTHRIVSEIPVPVCTAERDNYYVREKLLFQEKDYDRLKLLIEQAKAKGETIVRFRCGSEQLYREMLDELFEQQKIFTLVNGDAITYSSDDKMHTIFVFMQ